MVHCIHVHAYRGFRGFNFQIFLFLSPQIVFVSRNSVDPDKMPHYAAFHLGHHYLPKYPSSRSHHAVYKGVNIEIIIYIKIYLLGKLNVSYALSGAKKNLIKQQKLTIIVIVFLCLF